MSFSCHSQSRLSRFITVRKLPSIKAGQLLLVSLLLTSPMLTIAKPSTTNKAAPTDWTPVLKTMQFGCDLPDIDNAPPTILASITSLTAANKNTVPDGYKTLVLKNAVAWGYPIKRIQYGSIGAGFSSATVYFADNRFMGLRSRFYLPTSVGKVKASDKIVVSDANAFAGQVLANGFGYNDGRVGVNFSQKTNSITCSWAHLTG